MQTENNTTTPEARKPWGRPEIVLISQANVEANKVKTAGHEKTFIGSSAGTPARHFVNFQALGHTVFTPLSVTVGDFVS